MARDDDYEYRRREAIEDDLRQQARDDFDKAQRDRTSAVYGGIGEMDAGKVRTALNIPPASENFRSSRDERVPRTPTAGEQFREHSGRLLSHLKWSEALSEILRQEWAARIEQLDIEQPTVSLSILAEVSESYQRILHLEPPASDYYHATRWVDQVPRIGHEIGWLKDILNHVIALDRERDQE